MRLSALFSDGMVLQRDQYNLLWGYTKPNQKIEGTFADISFQGTANKRGYFEILLPKLCAGGPYELYMLADEDCHITDILVGDVFLLGGQSNMEIPINRTLDLFWKEIEETEEPFIRMFEVPKEYEFGCVREDIISGKWIQAKQEELLTFSAIGYFTAKYIRETESIPIGFIQTAVGGTPIQAWCSEESLRREELYIDEIEQCKDKEYVANTIEKETKREELWHREANQLEETKEQEKGELVIPGLWKGTKLESFHGTIVLEKKVILTKEQLELHSEAYVVLGAIVDADKVYINDVFVGETGYKYPPRRYKIPYGVLKEGENIIQIRMFVFRETGGFIPGKIYAIEFGTSREHKILLDGVWNYQIAKTMPVLPDLTFFQYKASGVYNAMIYPVRKWNIQAVLFYQGESNTDHPRGYSKLMKMMIKDWRKLWNKDNLPVFYAQLTAFSDSVEDCKTENWSILREEQRKILKLPHTAMVVTLDAGEYNDLHPQDKKTVGYRFSLVIRKYLYKEKIVASGPIYSYMEKQEGKIIIHFEETGSGLRMLQTEGVNGFEICGKEEVFVSAQAKISENTVIVWSEEIQEPVKVRYAWRDYPKGANLYNQEGLPASPFMV